MQKQDVKYYQDLLLKERQRVVDQLHSGRDKLGDLNRHEVGDVVDAAFNMYEKDRTIEMSENEKRLLRSIDAALLRIQNQTYGVCVVCGKFIDKKRLKALPWTTRCVDPKKCSQFKK